MTRTIEDVRYAIRQLTKQPLFTFIAVVSLAIGIASTTTVFAVANALLLRERPGISERGLVDVGRTQNRSGFDNLSYPNYRDYREGSRNVLLDLAAYRMEPEALSLTTGSAAKRIYGTTVSGNYFSVLGVTPQLGRFFRASEDVAVNRDLVAVASDRFWRDRLGARPEVVGNSIILNGRNFTLIGVAPPGFTGTSIIAPDVWLPIHAMAKSSLLEARQAVWLLAIGRLREGVSVAQAQADLAAVAGSLARQYPVENKGQGIQVLKSSRLPAELGTMVCTFLLLLAALVVLILVATCINVAGMMLSRIASRQREMAIRLALGAGLATLVRLIVTETAVLFAMGGAAGMLLAIWCASLLPALVPHLPVPAALNLPIDARVFLFAAGVTLASALFTGLQPALHATRRDLTCRVTGEIGDNARSPLRARHLLVVAQIALSMLLVVAAGLMGRALQKAGDINPGFDPTNVDIASLDFEMAGLTETSGRPVADDLLNRLKSTPGVEAASMAVDLPLDGGGFGFGALRPADRALPDDRPLRADWNIVTPDFFRAMRIRLAAGRTFDDNDRAGAANVAIINETFARNVWPGENPIGKRLKNDDVELQVVGVERDLKYRSLGEAPRMFIYVPLAQRWFSRVKLVVRRSTGGSLIPAIREAVRSVNAYLPVVDAQPLTEYVAIGLLPQRIALAFAGTLGLVGLLLAGIGVYGVMAWAVNARTREIGVRMALGASRSDVLRMVLRRAGILCGIGVVVWAALALVCAQAVRGLLYEIGPADPLTYILAVSLFAGVTVVATLAPARRAISIEPAGALRRDH